MGTKELRASSFAYSGDSGHPIRSIPATCSDPFRPAVPEDSGHPPGGATLELKDFLPNDQGESSFNFFLIEPPFKLMR